MLIRTLSSGSGGNCTAVVGGSSAVLVDAGISMRRILGGLTACQLDPGALTAILVTHCHTDHIGGLGIFARRFSLPVLGTEATCQKILERFPELRGQVFRFDYGERLSLGDITAVSAPTLHDAPQSVCFRLEAEGHAAAIATDLGRVTDQVLDLAAGAEAVVLEANHDLDMLRTGPYPESLKQRILSPYGHLSNDAGGAFAAALARLGTRQFLLAHLSKENNRPELALGTVGAALLAAGFVPGEDVSLSAAPEAALSEELWLL